MNHIPQELPQFSHERAIIAITGTREAKFFSVHDGAFEEKGMIEIPREHYSDDEGFFMRMVRGFRMGAGSEKNNLGDKLDKKFIKDFHIKLMEVLNTNHYDKIYLFSPDYIGKRLVEDLPHEIRPLVNYVGRGNYLKRPPEEMLEMIKTNE